MKNRNPDSYREQSLEFKYKNANTHFVLLVKTLCPLWLKYLNSTDYSFL